jgi:vacuolar-type H+-ATPase subunit C/Vma6
MLEDSPYAYAKACGIIGKSFLGKRISSLTGLSSLNELDKMIFPDHHSDLPGRELLVDLERRIIARTVRQILVIAGSYADPPELIVHMLRAYEYNDLKTCIQYIAAGKKNLPVLCDIGRFRTVRFDAFPDIGAMLKNTEIKPLLSESLRSIRAGSTDITSIETKLDNIYYSGLVKSLSQFNAEDRLITQRILADEISLRNCGWAFRLRVYYQKRTDDTVKYLMDIKLDEESGSLLKEAVESFGFPLDSRDPWKGWKWEKLLNEDTKTNWTVDPRYFQNAASQYLYTLARRGFRSSPLSASAIFCFIKLKQFEENILTSIAEGLALGIDSTGVFNLLEVAS